VSLQGAGSENGSKDDDGEDEGDDEEEEEGGLAVGRWRRWL
jgi:hypothetical protein